MAPPRTDRSHDASAAPTPPGEIREAGSHDTIVRISLGSLFAPESDPSLRFPDHWADIEGYATAGDGTVALAVTGGGPHAETLLEELWAGLARKGVAVRRAYPRNGRGRPVVVMTIRFPLDPGAVALLRADLILPVHFQAGQAELRLAGPPSDVVAIESALRSEGLRPTSVRPAAEDQAATGTKLSAEDWAFLGLLCSLGVFDGPDPPSRDDAAHLIGLDSPRFAQRVRDIEKGMRSLVAGLFAPPTDAFRGSPVAG
jgi:hypothetical protein